MPADDTAGKVDAVDLLWVVGDGDRVASLMAGSADDGGAVVECKAAVGERAVDLVADGGVEAEGALPVLCLKERACWTSSITAVVVTARWANAVRLAYRQAASGKRSRPIIIGNSTMRRRRACQVARSGLRLLAMSVLV